MSITGKIILIPDKGADRIFSLSSIAQTEKIRGLT
jgi:hypothetical protein